MSTLAVSGLRRSFGHHPVLTGLDLEVPAGSFTAILGASGSGKTTLLRLLAGFDAPDGGSVTVGGRVMDDAVTHVAPEHRRIGYVPQDGALFPHLRVAANVGFGLPRAQRKRAAAALLETVGLGGLGDRYPHQLSGGQQQRVALARALAISPQLVLLDEPFASLDAGLRASVREDVRRILRETSTTAVLVTHDQDEALSVADQVAILRDGRMAQCGPPHQVYRTPADAQLARFLGEANLFAARFDGATARTPLGTLAAHPAAGAQPGEVTVLIRPEAVGLGDAGGQGVPGHITRIEYHGHDAVIHVAVQHASAGVQQVIARTAHAAGLAVGSRVTLSATGPVLVWPIAGAGPALAGDCRGASSSGRSD